MGRDHKQKPKGKEKATEADNSKSVKKNRSSNASASDRPFVRPVITPEEMHLVGLLCTIIQGNILSKAECETDLWTLESVKAVSYTCTQAFNCLAEYIGLKVQFTINTGDLLVQTMMHHPRCVVIKEECGRGPYTINRVLSLPQFQHVQ
eukprot:TRINITY_DN694_c0_g1_i2.p1 TRINITY_DN694_c0_g1~~TRINITY_DN694_c0_g1_i2.p1  ORF type:complete len:149 (+),score=11.22 TRINITY_DN694_c0_g1_i2:114-560(+)